ncbi:RluA family pseudouridine synthase [Thermodesulfobacteriota bacterium]
METNGLTILHADPHIAVVEKPGGLLAVPGRGPDKQDCVAARIRHHFPDSIAQPAVHRLDMATSGLMVFGLTRAAHRHLSRQFEDRLVEKQYLALVDGIVTGETGTIKLRFRLDPDNRPYQVYDPVQGKLGITSWCKIGIEGKLTRIEFTPLTGRTHQLRLHAAHEQGLHCPIVGDRLYGRGKEGDRMLLHASFLRFIHPDTGETMSFASVPPF